MAHVALAPGTFGYSVEQAGFTGITPVGFSGYCLYPSSLFLADLAIDFVQPITDFSIMYAVQEYNCNDSATLRVTAYLAGALVGTNTATVAQPGTWPTGTLTFADPQAFDQVVIHYDSDPPTCQDYIRAFMVDNLIVTPAGATAVPDKAPVAYAPPVVYPNPTAGATTVRFSVARPGPVSVTIYDLRGRLVRTLANGASATVGRRDAHWDGKDAGGRPAASGIYLCRIEADGQTHAARVMLVRRP